MAGKEFLESIELNFKQAVKLLNINKSESALTDDLADQIMQANSTYLVRFGVRLRNKVFRTKAAVYQGFHQVRQMGIGTRRTGTWNSYRY